MWHWCRILVERENVDKLPIISENMQESDVVIVVDDSKAGWAKAFRELVALLYSGMIPSWDVSKIRPAGAKLKDYGWESIRVRSSC